MVGSLLTRHMRSHYNISPHDQQLAVFRKQCAMAVELKLPLIVHSREAEQETITYVF